VEVWLVGCLSVLLPTRRPHPLSSHPKPPCTALHLHWLQSLPVETTTLGDVLALFKQGRSHMVVLTSQLSSNAAQGALDKTVKRSHKARGAVVVRVRVWFHWDRDRMGLGWDWVCVCVADVVGGGACTQVWVLYTHLSAAHVERGA
jgi:hypothetical protein